MLHDCAAVCALASLDRVVKHGTCTQNMAMQLACAERSLTT